MLSFPNVQVELENCKRLYNLTEEQKMQVRKDLTFINPAYDSVMKYSRYTSTKIPRYLYYYKEDRKAGTIEVPLGYELPFEWKFLVDSEVSDKRKVCTVDFPKFLFELRDLQKEAVKNWLSEYACFGSVGTIILPTGAGKTICGIFLANCIMQRTLIVVNKDDLVAGWKKDIEDCFGGEADVGIVKGKEFKIGKHFTITTIQTLSRLGDVKLQQLYDNISFIICDETHRVGAKSYQVLLGFPAKYRLGLTATKMRNDGLVDVIDLLCGKTVYDGTKEETDAIIPAHKIVIIRNSSKVRWKPKKTYFHTKSLQNVHSFQIEGEKFIEGTKEWYEKCEELEAEGVIKANPLKLHEAFAKIAEDIDFNEMVVEDIKTNYNEGKSCIVFCKTVEQLNNLYDMLLPSCPKIQKFFGGMKEKKEEVLRKAESKEVSVTLATVAIATEGTNVKSWEVGFLVSSVANEKDLIQILGRLRRTKEGKESVIFYDYRHPYVAGIRNHGYKRDLWYKNLGIRS